MYCAIINVHQNSENLMNKVWFKYCVLYRWCASYVIAAILVELNKGFSLSASIFSSNMAKISLSFESHGIGCTPPINNTIFFVYYCMVAQSCCSIFCHFCLIFYSFFHSILFHYLIWLIMFLLVHFILFQFNFNLFVLFCFHFFKKYYFKF